MLKPGRYETQYGNVAILKTSTAKTALDIDSGERIPVELLWKYLGREQK